MLKVYKERIDDHVIRYEKSVHEREKQMRDVVCAFVTFRSMEGAARLIKAYEHKEGACSSLCSDGKEDPNKLFVENRLKVERASQPTLINWDNLQYSSKNRWMRRRVVNIASCVLLLFFFAILIFLEYTIQTENLLISEIAADCDDIEGGLTIQDAYIK